ncbi:hypothetical protein RN001_006344 [Aquatica leii]|uniref:Uncharacterized protein n=1 Tax=Aquatica leii TaxID=1421715 RepID=A0AAN7Q8S0_9COLE|nr:hypothetical protein RN001_006344 [Aquatica leii]
MPLTIKSRVNDNDRHEYDITCLIFHNNKLYSSSDDGKIKIWNKNIELLNQVQAHPCSVYSITIGNDNVYSCSNDGTVKVYTLEGLTETIISQEANEMYKVNFNEGKLYVGDDSGLVRIFFNNKLVGILEVMHPITDLLALGNLIYTARDLYVLISEIHPEGKRMSTLKAIEGRAPICVVGDKLCFFSRTGKDIFVHRNLKVNDFEKIGEVKDAHELIINAVCGFKNDDGEFLYTGGWDKTLKKWKLGSTIDLVDKCSIDFPITAITVGNNDDVYVGGGDGNIVNISL